MAGPSIVSPSTRRYRKRVTATRRHYAVVTTPDRGTVPGPMLCAPLSDINQVLARLRLDPGFLNASTQDYVKLSALVRAGPVSLATSNAARPELRTYVDDTTRLRHDFHLAALLFPDAPLRQQLFTAYCQAFASLKYSRVLMLPQCVGGRRMENGVWHLWRHRRNPNDPRKRPRCWPYSSMAPGDYFDETPPHVLPPGVRVNHLTDYNAMALLLMGHEYYGTLAHQSDLLGHNPYNPRRKEELANWVRLKARFPFFGDETGRMALPTDEVVAAAQTLRRPGVHTKHDAQRPLRPYWSGDARGLQDFNRALRPSDHKPLPLVMGPHLCLGRNVNNVKLDWTSVQGKKDRIVLFQDPAEQLASLRHMARFIAEKNHIKTHHAPLADEEKWPAVEEEEEEDEEEPESGRKRRVRQTRNTAQKKKKKKTKQQQQQPSARRQPGVEAKQQHPEDVFDGLPDLMQLEPTAEGDDNDNDKDSEEWQEAADIAEVLQGGVKPEPPWDASYGLGDFDPLRPDLDALCVGGVMGERLD
jgi:hypothetical protein